MLLLLFVLVSASVYAFNPVGRVGRASHVSMVDKMFAESDTVVELDEGQLTRQRYIASNRFQVRDGKGPKFEKRWADRKSRLATLDGFRFFTLLKRTHTEGFDMDAPDYHDGNYVSFTIWENKDNFDAWRTGDAFKEAHGGGKFNIAGFVSLISTALFIIKGSPKPAFYDALLPVSENILKYKPHLSSANEDAEGGWRQVDADGTNDIPPEVFVSQDLYTVKDGMAAQFERGFADKMAEQGVGEGTAANNGMLSFSLLRRDATKADDGVTHSAWRLWTDETAYKAWKGKTRGADFISDTTSATKTALYEGKLTLVAPQGP
jgi:heme-degrading monooxygenase HmoA